MHFRWIFIYLSVLSTHISSVCYRYNVGKVIEGISWVRLMCRQGASSLARSKNIKLIITGGLMLVNKRNSKQYAGHNRGLTNQRIWEYFLYPSKVVLRPLTINSKNMVKTRQA